MKIKLATLRKLAASEGYTGDQNDAEAMKAFLIGKNVTMVSIGGKPAVETKALQVEHNGSTEVVVRQVDESEGDGEAKAMDSDEESNEDEEKSARDIDVRIKALVEKALRKAGADDATGKRPGMPGTGSTVQISIKPAMQAWYESRIKTGKAFFKSAEQAMVFRDKMTVNVFGNSPHFMNHRAVAEARKAFQPGGVWHKAGYATSPTAAGGALVATDFYPDIIANLDQYGVARQLTQVVPMSTDKTVRPQKVGRHVVSYPEENAATTPSTAVTYSMQSLQAKTGVIIVQASRQIIDDAQGSGIAYLDDVAWDIARAFAFTEDSMLLTANGEADYANVFGHIPKLAAIGYGTAAGLVAGGGSMDAHTEANLDALIAKLPSYAIEGSVFTCTPQAAALIFLRLAQSSGGVTYEEQVNGGRVLKWHGIPVIVNNVMNTTNSTGTNTVDLLYGRFDRSSMLGDRMSLEMDISDQAYWTSYGIGVRGVMRHDVNVYDIGTASVAGPVVGLYQT